MEVKTATIKYEYANTLTFGLSSILNWQTDKYTHNHNQSSYLS